MFTIINALVGIGFIGTFIHLAVGWKGEKWKDHMENPYMRGSTVNLAAATTIIVLSILNDLTLDSFVVSVAVVLAWVYLFIRQSGMNAEEGTLVRASKFVVKKLDEITFCDHDGKRKLKEGVDVGKTMVDIIDGIVRMEPVGHPLLPFSLRRVLKADGTYEKKNNEEVTK